MPKVSQAVTHISRNFAGIVEKDPETHKKNIRLLAPLYYAAEVGKFKEGDEVTLVLTNKKPKRTEQQNRYWWGAYLPAIIKAGKGAGSPLDTHEDLARKFLTVREWRNSLGQICYIRASTTELSIGQFMEFIRAVEEETGIPSPSTEGYNFES